MKCASCGKDIDESSTFCEECKKNIKKSSSRREYNEFVELIDKNKEMNNFEDTKILYNIEDLNISDNIDFVNDNDKVLTREEKNKDEYKKVDYKKIIIIILSVLFCLVALFLIVYKIINIENHEEETFTKIDYKEVLNEYSNDILNNLKEYMNNNEELPTWQVLNDLITYDKHDVVCNIHEIYSDLTIYLDECSIDNNSIKYSIGNKKEELIEGKSINIYKDNDKYTDIKTNDLVGTIMCKSNECNYYKAFDKYVIIKEGSSYYLYNYTNNIKEFGPFNIENDNYILSYNEVLYGIIYSDDITNIYNVMTGKTLKNIKGNLLVNDDIDYSILYKYGYVIMNNNNTNNFINLKTGNISYKINDNIGNIYERYDNKMLYITSYKDDINKFKITNSNGKLLFNGKTYLKMELKDDGIFLLNDNSFEYYDYNLNKITISKVYTNIFTKYKDYIVVLDNNVLKIVDINDSILAYQEEWDNINIFDSVYEENDSLYIIIKNKNDKQKYYYNKHTKILELVE